MFLLAKMIQPLLILFAVKLYARNDIFHRMKQSHFEKVGS